MFTIFVQIFEIFQGTRATNSVLRNIVRNFGQVYEHQMNEVLNNSPVIKIISSCFKD